MRKAAAKKTTSIEDMERSMAVMAARQDFLNAALNMSWQLALTILVPVFIGTKLDAHFHSSPSYTLASLVIAVALAVAVVAKTLKGVAKNQAEDKDKEKSTE